MSCAENLFNPLDGNQYIFLGCSIRLDQPIAWRLGYNEDVSTMTIGLVRDACATTGTKVTYDLQTKAALGATLNLDAHTFQSADPGFAFPNPGEPVYFRLGDSFNFGGIVQSYTKNNSPSEKDTFNVTISDPREILEGCQVILDGYVGGTYGTPNVFNVYALQERYGSTCFEAYLSDLTGPGAFGGSQVNEFGMSWNRIRSSLMMLCSSIPGANTNWGSEGRIRFAGYDYLLDITEIPRINNYRINADTISIADLIKEVTSFLSFDYYVTLEHIMLGNEVIRVIKVRTVDRRGAQQLGSISDFIGNSEGVTDSEVGLELRNENTASILVGGPKIDMFTQTDNYADVLRTTLFTETSCTQILADPFDTIPDELQFLEINHIVVGNNWKSATIAPFWGFKPDGGVIIGQDTNLRHNFTIDVSHAGITNRTNTKRLTYYNISVQEIHCALAGKDVWLSYVAAAKPEIAEALGLDDAPFDFLALLGRALIRLDNDLKAPGATPQDLIRIRKQGIQAYHEWYNMLNDRQRIQFNIDTLFRIVEHYGTNFYGRKFMIRMYDQSTGSSFVCAKKDSFNSRVTFSREVADAGWTDYTAGFMGLQSQALLDRFRTDDDRIECFVRFNAAQNLMIPDLDNTEFVYQNVGRINTKFDANIYNDAYEDQINFLFSETLFIRAQAEPDFVFPTTACGNPDYSDPRVVITLPTFIKQKVTEITQDIPYFLQFLFRGLGGIQALQGQPIQEVPDAAIVAAIRSLMSSAGITGVHAGEDQLRILPGAVTIPLKSNIATYGPWFATAVGTEGKAVYRQDDSQVPWNYGDSTSMNTAASLLVTESLSIMQKSERGSLTMPGLPLLNLGDEINSGGSSVSANRELLIRPYILDDIEFTAAELTSESWKGLQGANVTEISINIGQGGITTTYNMRTYTPSLTRNKYYAERIKARGLLAQQNRRRRRGTFERPEDLRRVITNITNDLLRQRQEQTGIFAKSPHAVLVGQNFTYTGDEDEYGNGAGETLTRSVVQTQNLMEVASELSNWETKHLMSLDGLLVPVTTKQFTEPERGENEDNSTAPITSVTLNPFLGPDDREPGNPLANNYCGHNIEFVARDSGIPEDLNIRHQDEYATDHYRFFAHRTPMVLAGYGFDEDGKPVPNEADDPDYEGDGKSDKFLKNWLRRPDTWKVGMLDVRWNEKRGLWTAFGDAKIRRAIMCTDMQHTILATGYAILPNADLDETLDPEGEDEETDPNCPGTKITIYNTSGKPVRKGANIVCYYSSDENGYITLEVPDPIYAVYIPDNINWGGVENTTGVGYLYDNLLNYFNAHIITPTGSIVVHTLNQPIRGGATAICYERTLNHFYLIKSQHNPMCVVTNVECVTEYTPGGTSTSLVVCDRTLWLESNWTIEDCGDTTPQVGGCNPLARPEDMQGYEEDG